MLTHISVETVKQIVKLVPFKLNSRPWHGSTFPSNFRFRIPPNEVEKRSKSDTVRSQQNFEGKRIKMGSIDHASAIGDIAYIIPHRQAAHFRVTEVSKPNTKPGRPSHRRTPVSVSPVLRTALLRSTLICFPSHAQSIEWKAM